MGILGYFSLYFLGEVYTKYSFEGVVEVKLSYFFSLFNLCMIFYSSKKKV